MSVLNDNLLGNLNIDILNSKNTGLSNKSINKNIFTQKNKIFS